jgi:hypothetical protein
MFYILKDIISTLAPNLLENPNCIILRINSLKIDIINVYNDKYPEIPNSLPFIKREYFSSLNLNKEAFKYILIGDFNMYHP